MDRKEALGKVRELGYTAEDEGSTLMILVPVSEYFLGLGVNPKLCRKVKKLMDQIGYNGSSGIRPMGGANESGKAV